MLHFLYFQRLPLDFEVFHAVDSCLGIFGVSIADEGVALALSVALLEQVDVFDVSEGFEEFLQVVLSHDAEVSRHARDVDLLREFLLLLSLGLLNLRHLQLLVGSRRPVLVRLTRNDLTRVVFYFLA